MEATKDRHKTGKMFRLPDEFHQLIKGLAARNERPMSREILIAIKKHLADNGLWPAKKNVGR